MPGVFKTPWNPDCSAGGFTCAAKFTIESATGLPILTTDAPQEYSLSGDTFATGINGGTKAIGIMYNGKPVANQVYCCGVIGITHKYNAADVYGTDFMVALAYGWKDSGGCCIAVNCGASNKYCVGAEEEENNDLYDYGTSPARQRRGGDPVRSDPERGDRSPERHHRCSRIRLPRQSSTRGPQSIWAAGAI